MDVFAKNQHDRQIKSMIKQVTKEIRDPKTSILMEDQGTGWQYELTVPGGELSVLQQDRLTSVLLTSVPNGTIYRGDTFQLAFTASDVDGDDITNDPELSVTYSSSDEAVATVSNTGLIEMIDDGSVTVTVSVSFRSAVIDRTTSFDVLDLTDLVSLIASVQSVHDAATEGDVHGQYPVGSKLTLQMAIDTAQATVDTHNSQAEIDSANSTLTQALNDFNSSVVVVSTTALSTLITEATTIRDAAVVGTGVGEYDQSEVDTLTSTIDSSQSMVDTYDTKTQDQIDQMYTTLENVKTTFEAAAEPAGNPGDLNTDIATATQLLIDHTEGTDPGQTTAEARTALQTAIDTAQAISDDAANQTQAMLDAAESQLETDIATFNAMIVV